jgi:hypothetical protein
MEDEGRRIWRDGYKEGGDNIGSSKNRVQRWRKVYTSLIDVGYEGFAIETKVGETAFRSFKQGKEWNFKAMCLLGEY